MKKHFFFVEKTFYLKISKNHLTQKSFKTKSALYYTLFKPNLSHHKTRLNSNKFDVSNCVVSDNLFCIFKFNLILHQKLRFIFSNFKIKQSIFIHIYYGKKPINCGVPG